MTTAHIPRTPRSITGAQQSQIGWSAFGPAPQEPPVEHRPCLLPPSFRKGGTGVWSPEFAGDELV